VVCGSYLKFNGDLIKCTSKGVCGKGQSHYASVQYYVNACDLSEGDGRMIEVELTW
jgi:hypothetical protein